MTAFVTELQDKKLVLILNDCEAIVQNDNSHFSRFLASLVEKIPKMKIIIVQANASKLHLPKGNEDSMIKLDILEAKHAA